jgi:translation initiation factor IF-3
MARGGGGGGDFDDAPEPDDFIETDVPDKSDRGEKPGAELVKGRATKEERAALKAKQRRQAKAAAEEQKYSKARIEKAKLRARKEAEAARSGADALTDAPRDLEKEVEAEAEAVRLGLKERVAQDDVEAQAGLLNEGVVPPVAVEIPATAPVDSTEVKAAKKGKVVPAAAAAAAAALKAAADLAASGRKASPAAIAAAKKEADRLKAIADAEAAVIRLNEKITAAQIALIDADGKKIPGLFSRADALRKAREAGLDLLQISPAHLVDRPAACKLLNYKQHMADKERAEREQRRAQKLAQREPKTMQLKSKIAAGDLGVKIERMRTFLNRNHPVRLIYISKNPDPVIFFPLLKTCVEKLQLDGAIEEGALTPTKHYVNFSPINEKKRRTLYPKLTEAEAREFGVYMDQHGTWHQRGRDEEGNFSKDEEFDEEEDEEVEEEEAKPAPAAAKPAPPAAAPVAETNGGKKDKHQKKKASYLSAPPMFSKAALMAKKAEAAAGAGNK